MRGRAAVGIDDDFASGQAAVSVRAADDEFAGGVDQIFGFFGQHFRRQNRFDDLLDNGFAQLVVADAFVVLGREDDGVDALHFAGFAVVNGGNLSFGIGTQPRQASVTAQFALALHQAVAVIDGKRHQHRSFVAGIAEHQSLVAGTLFQIKPFTFVNALCDVGRLLSVVEQYFAGIGGKAQIGRPVADAGDGFACYFFIIHFGGGGDFACQYA